MYGKSFTSYELLGSFETRAGLILSEGEEKVTNIFETYLNVESQTVYYI